MFHSLLRLLFLLCIAGTPLLAQQDHRVSIEPTTADLPAEIRIQAAGSIGTNTLVVWGGNRAEGIDTAISVLHSQLLRDTVIEGSPRQLHSDDARPWGFVSVVPFDDRYLVVWNDRRVAEPGAYMQWIDDDGAPIGREKVFSSEFIGTATSLRAFRTATGVTLFRHDRTGVSRLYMRRLSFDGRSLAEESEIASGIVVGVGRLAGFENLFQVRVDSLIYILRDDGQFDSRSIPSSRFNDPWYLGSDSTFVTLKDTTLRYFATPFETVPIRSITLPSLRNIDARTRMITSDSGNVQITFLTSNLLKERGFSSVNIEARRIIVGPDGDVSPILKIDSIHHFTDGGYAREVLLTSITTARHCGNAQSIRMNYTEKMYTSRGYDYGTNYHEWGFSVGEHGEYRAEPKPPQMRSCIDPSSAVAQPVTGRSGYGNFSTVAVTLNEGVYRLSTPVSRFAVHAAQGTPNIFRRGDRLMMTWRQEGPLNPSALAEWKPETGITSLVWESSLAVAPVRMLTSTALMASEYYIWSDFGSSESAYRTILQMADSRWSTRLEQGRGTRAGVMWATADPNRNESVAIINVPAPYRNDLLIQGIDSTGIKRWEMITNSTQDVFSSAVIAVDSSTILVYSHSSKRFTEIRNGVQKPSFAIDVIAHPGVVLRRLFGPRFLRFTPAIGASDPRFDIFSLQGTNETGLDLPISHIYSNPFFVESPIDSTIHILWASDNGVRLTRLDKYLRVLVRDSLISQTRDSVRSPAGVFRNDTLFVVWQDFRNATPDIYATSFVAGRVIAVPPDTTSTPDPPVTGEPPTEETITVGAITPNPARGTATFALELTEPGDATAEILDVTGQVLIRQTRHFDAGVQRWEIDVRDLASGLYLLSVQSGGTVVMSKLMVMQE